MVGVLCIFGYPNDFRGGTEYPRIPPDFDYCWVAQLVVQLLIHWLWFQALPSHLFFMDSDFCSMSSKFYLY